jgi:hypothetical protein
VVDEITIKLFNLPIKDQPRGILDMGCGNGAFLEQTFTVIERKSFCVRNFDPLIIELYTIPPSVMVANYGKTAATVYDATHGFSDQYIVENPLLHKLAAEAVLYPDIQYFKRFPDSNIATVSINLLKGK